MDGGFSFQEDVPNLDQILGVVVVSVSDSRSREKKRMSKLLLQLRQLRPELKIERARGWMVRVRVRVGGWVGGCVGKKRERERMNQSTKK